MVCTPDRIESIRKFIAELDVEPTWVKVRASLCQISIEDIEASGISTKNAARPIPAALPNPSTAAKTKSHDELFDVLKQKCPSLHLLANPTVIVVDGETAIMNIVSEIPVQQLTQTDAGGSIGTTVYREIGTKLEFAPTVNQDGQLTLNINSEFSAVSDWTEKNEPVIDRRTLNSHLRLSNGETTTVVGLGRGIRLGMRNKKPPETETASETEMETILIVTAEIMPPRHAEKPDATATWR